MTQLAADDFERADENPLGNGVWSAGTEPPCKIVSGLAVATNTGGADNISRYTGVSAPNDQWSEILVDSFCCPCVRIAAGAASYALAADVGAGSIAIYKRVAGTYTQIGTNIAGSIAAGHRIALGVAGQVYSVYDDGVLLGSRTDGAADLTAGDFGILTETTNKIRAWRGGDGTYSLPSSASNDSDVASRRNRPGRGPYSKGAYLRPRLEAFATIANLALAIDAPGTIDLTGQAIGLSITGALSDVASNRNRPGRGPYSVGRYFRPRIDAYSATTTPLALAIDIAGSVTLAGQSVTFALEMPISTQGAITFAGQSLTLANGLNLSIDTPGSITVAGQSVAFSTSLPLTNGSITLAGQTVALDLAAPAALSIDVPGSIVFAGQAISMTNSSQAQSGMGSMGPHEPVRSMFHASHRKPKARKSPDSEPASSEEIADSPEIATPILARAAPAIEPPTFAVPLTDLLDVQTRLELAARRVSIAKAANDEHEQALLLAMIALWND